MLYSLSRMLANNQALHSLIKAMRKKVEQNLIIKRAVAPTDDTMFNAILGVWGIDEDTTLLKSESGSSLLSDIKTMCQVSRFDPETKEWIFFAPPSQVNGAIDRGAAVDAVLDPIVRALLGRRWETAALSRWTGVMSTLKRMLLGTLWNGILPKCLSRLSASMGISQERVSSLMDEACKAVRDGQPVDQTAAAMCMKVEMRLSSWPCRLQVLLSENISRDDMEKLAQAFVSTRGCCFGHLGRRQRKHFLTVELVLSPR